MQETKGEHLPWNVLHNSGVNTNVKHKLMMYLSKRSQQFTDLLALYKLVCYRHTIKSRAVNLTSYCIYISLAAYTAILKIDDPALAFTITEMR